MFFRETKCWAARAGNCSEKITREHIVSDNLFTGKVTVSGLHWCKHGPKSVGMSSLTSKMLCKFHNNALSIFDQEAGRLFHKLAEIVENRAASPAAGGTDISFDGLKVERWFVKTALNILLHKTPKESRKLNLPYLLNILFLNERFESPFGLQAFKSPQVNVSQRHHVQFGPLVSQVNNEIVGGIFDFRGIKFGLRFPSVDGLAPDAVIGMPASMPEWHNLQAYWHPTQINLIDLSTECVIQPLKLFW